MSEDDPNPHQRALNDLLDAAPDGILLVQGDGRIAFVNDAAEHLFGYRREDLVGETVETLVPKRFHARHASDRDAYAAHPLRRPMGMGLELRGLRRDGSEFPVEISLTPTTSSTGERLTAAIIRDATEQRLMQEERLRYARSQAVEEIVGGLEAIVWEATAPDRESLTYLGGREGAFLGYPRADWLKAGFWLSIVHAEDRLTAFTFAENARDEDSFELEYRLIASDGSVRRVRDIVTAARNSEGEIDRLRGVIVDITERLELEARLAEAQKMEAVGQLAGGIAHDFNNLLTVVSGYAMRLRARPEFAQTADDLDQIITAADRAAELTRQLLAFARRDPGEISVINPSVTISRLEPMLRRLIDADIVFDFHLDRQAPSVLMDGTRLEQILMNLIINASDAMPQGGTLTVRTDRATVSEPGAARAGLAPGPYALISVSDTGIGIAPELRDRIFEPFFTTKQGKGTGMGLATVYGVVDQAGGRIDVESIVGQGTTFRVQVPAISGPADQVASAPDGGRATLLLVEDEPALRRLAVMMLEEEGYTVLQAGNGLDALTVAERHRGPLDLLITDVVMPKLSGPELAQQLRGLRPELEVLFMSGYNDSRLVHRGVVEAKANLLGKPFTPADLITRVAELVEPET